MSNFCLRKAENPFLKAMQLTLPVCRQRDLGFRFELLVVPADGHRTLSTQRIDD
jgi:hypothetical protein